MSFEWWEDGRSHQERTFQKMIQREAVLITGKEGVEIVTRATKSELSRFAAVKEEGKGDLFVFPIMLDLGDVPATGLGDVQIALDLAGNLTIGIVDDKNIELTTIR